MIADTISTDKIHLYVKNPIKAKISYCIKDVRQNSRDGFIM